METPSHRPLSKFVLRTPVLPFHVLAQWTGRETLRQLVEDPTIREALYVASPELDAQIAGWQRDPDTAQSSSVERALVRYVSRMGFRCTPFGLFAAVSVGTVEDATNLEVKARAAAARHTRLDNDLLFALCSDLGRDRGVRRHLRYRANQSLYAAAGRLRYAEARLAGPVRAYHLVAVDRSDYLEALLARAAAGATFGELCDVLCADPEISRDEAEAFVDEVIDAQLLVAELQPAVTGAEPTAGIIASLERAGLAQLAAPLRAAEEALAAIDSAAPGVAADAYRAIEKQLAAGVPTRVEPSRLFQVDLFKPAPTATLGGAVLDELQRGISLLHRLTPGGGDPQWARFRDKFMARYETREVPLVEVLDEEVGIGFGDAAVGVGAAPLINDLAFGGGLRGPARTVPMDRRELHLLQLVTHAVRTSALEVELTDDDLDQLASNSALPLADVITAGACVIGDSPEAVAAGNFQLRISHAGGGANLLGRFCHGSAEVAELTAEALRAEEALRPDAIFAEIVHLPEGRIGNVLLRPVLRSHEIAFLGTSGADADKQIAITDLTVSVEGDRVVLRSRKLGKEVIPRMTTAHNYSARSLALYRFLCSHALQNVGGAYWTWGGLEDFPYLPRVRHGKLILSRARWLVTRRDLAPIEAACAGSPKTPDQVRAQRAKVAAAVAALRTKLGLPRWVVIGDGDNELAVDLENELMVDSAAHLIKNRPAVVLFELLPAADQLCTHSPEGTFTHELFVLFRRTAEPRSAPHITAAPTHSPERRFLPGSPWLYLKLYTGTATADALLRDALAPAIHDAVTNRKLADSWFFIRYADPDWHVRLRFAGDPSTLTGKLLPFLYEQLAPACTGGLLWRVVVDTYEREVERYGGPFAIELAERFFHADSDAVLSIIASCQGDAGTQAAWRLALRGIDQLLDDLGLTLPDKLALATRARDNFGAELGMTTAFQKQLGEKFRAHQKEIAALLEAPAHAPDHPFAPALAAFAQRSARLRPIASELRALAEQRALVTPFESIVLSYVHMHVNRMIRTSQRPHELVLYDLLRRHYDGVLARAKRAAKPVKAVA